MSPAKRKYKLPDNLTFDKTHGLYKWRNPLTGKPKGFGKDRAVAIKRAEDANRVIEIRRQKLKNEASGVTSVGHVIRLYMELIVPRKPWADSTRTNKLAALRKYEREFGQLAFIAIDRVYIADWLEQYDKADTYNDHRKNLMDVWAFGISRKLADINEPALTLERSNSMKIKANQRDRGILTLEQYQAIHDIADPFLQIAMDTSLITLQGRAEICRIQDGDLRDGFLYFIRQKTSAESDMAFLRIAATDEILELRRKSRRLGPPCPYWINRIPERQASKADNNKLHSFAVMPGYLSKAFQRARDKTDLFNDVDMKNRPTLHSVRGLGSRIYESLGYDKNYIRGLMAHGDAKTTDIYLHDPTQLRDEHFSKVEAGLILGDLKSIKGV